MMNSIVLFFRFIKENFGRFVLGLFLVVVFLFILFPFSDLNDLISSQVSKATANRIYMQFEELHLNPFTATLSMDKVFVETPQTATLSVDQLSASPSITALIQGKPGGSFHAQGFLKGDVKIALAPTSGGKSDSKDASKIDKYSVDASAQNLSLKEFKDLLNLSLPISGKLNLALQGTADINFVEQPEGELTVTINKFELPPSSVSLQDMGRVNLPEIKWGQVELKGKLAGGKFVIETGKIGNNKDDFYGDIKGDLGLTIQNFGGQITPVIGSYNISLDMKATNAFKERAKFFLSFLDGYKKEDGSSGTQYKFRIQATAMGMPPQFTPLQ